ncbi:MAG: hypothetical protein IJZ33_01840 [Clostridia bacterium]|nr:hypothetical protein [Clostridia bacterium]
MKKILFTVCTLLTASALPCLAFAEDASPSLSADAIMEIVWYVILVLLFGGGLIAISKWSKKINERDEQLKQELSQLSEDDQERDHDPEEQSDEHDEKQEEDEQNG